MPKRIDLPSPHLYRLHYVSRVDPGIQMAAVEAILARAREFNKLSDLTGQLLFTGTHFSHVLEGSLDCLRLLMSSIQRDSRHHDLRVVAEGHVHARSFEGSPIRYVQDPGLRDLVEELWWAQRIDQERTAQLVQHLEHQLLPRPLWVRKT